MVDTLSEFDGYHCLIVPGWRGSGGDHWQTHWQHRLPRSSHTRVASWDEPALDDWVGALDRATQPIDAPILLIAHSLGCITVAHWTAIAEHSQRIAGALLVAPADVERGSVSRPLAGLLPFPCTTCHSRACWSAPPTTLPPAPSVRPSLPSAGRASWWCSTMPDILTRRLVITGGNLGSRCLLGLWFQALTSSTWNLFKPVDMAVFLPAGYR
ncbi:alpha/beta hydrolase family protein [Halomonas elongata]|uniref:Alpha/beta hydrolase family protein n=1 Tax=Halomonas elongata TaxID=2746 RepID=A0A1B8P4Z8_HALEL|nr:alpha/beta hydrolase family protein [Halomonas elongata]